MTDPEAAKHRHCSIKHRRHFVECTEGVIYQIPLRCQKVYVGQTGLCVNDKLREHIKYINNVLKRKNFEGFLASHCLVCKDNLPKLESMSVIRKGKTCVLQEIIESERIASLAEQCFSMPSITLSEEEVAYLRMRG